MPVLSVAPTQRPVAIRPMRTEDIPAVMAIERLSFPRPWPERAYRYELTENPNAYFIVACVATRASYAGAGDSGSWLQRLSGRLRSGLRPLPTTRAAGDAGMFPLGPGAVVGFAGMWMLVDEAHIATIASHPDLRGRGIGEFILIDLLHAAQRRAAAMVTLEVRVSNTVAQALYHKYGFEQVGLRRGYYQDNREDALLMTITDFASPRYRDHLAELERTLADRLSSRAMLTAVEH